MSKFSQKDLDEINNSFKTPQEVLKWALDNLHPKVAKASSFGAEDSVIIDMMVKINPNSRFFTLDTGRLNQETYDLMDEMSKKHNINFEVMFPEAKEVQEMVKSNGINLFYDNIENRRLCCGIRKVHPLRKILSTLDGWITGIRREQTSIRKDSVFVEFDKKYNNILKINPLLNWTWEQVWDYIRKNDIPYHKLLDKGYTSIGCAPCTRATKPGDDLRSGRWWWESDEHKECGLHMEHGV